jgi:hypothetical protein
LLTGCYLKKTEANNNKGFKMAANAMFIIKRDIIGVGSCEI